MDVVVDGMKDSRQRYVPNTAIPETTIDGAGGTARIWDFAPRFRRFGRMFRPPMLMRRLEPVAGRPRITLRLRPTFNTARASRRSRWAAITYATTAMRRCCG